jgi:hypothetical protein
MKFSRIRLAALAICLVLLAGVGVALAAKPRKGWSYETDPANPGSFYVNFSVAKNGKRVIKLNAAPAVTGGSCIPGVVTLPSQRKPVSAPISKRGTFKAKVTLYDPSTHKADGRETVAGTFQKHNRVRGKVTTRFTNPQDEYVAYNGTCHGASQAYVAKGAKGAKG